MERLTERMENVPDGDSGVWVKQHDYVSAAVKLAEYEDLEEQGLLLKPPVAVGAKVYEIIEDPIPNHRFYIGEYEVQDVSAKAVKYCGDWIEYDCPNLYFNKSEAEAKLKELRNRNEKQ